jgi:predicted transcriptional regulator of viral defense system
MNVLEQFGIIPIDFATLATVFGEYKSPKDKISKMEKSGELIRLKKGLFVVAPEVHRLPVSKELIANHIYGPSYISLESALSFYGLIPERVYAIRSITIKRSRNFSNQLGNFNYTSVAENYYPFGIRQEIFNDQYAYLIATPEKAICDIILTTNGLRLQSMKAMKSYLEEDLRIDFTMLKSINPGIIRLCSEAGKKKTELTLLSKLFEDEHI